MSVKKLPANTRKRMIMVLLAGALLLMLVRLLPDNGGAFAAAASKSGVCFVIDAGHGGPDGGTVGRAGTVEKDINLALTLKLRSWCDLFGIPYVLTRDSDRSLHSENADTLHKKKAEDLHRRLEIANTTEKGVYIGIHQNFYNDTVSHGAQVFWSENMPQSRDLALTVQQSLAKSLGKYGLRSAASAPQTVYILKNALCPAVIVECGFLSNPEEEMLLNTDMWQSKIAMCIAYVMLGLA